jgi:hypothetical protein
MKQAPLLLFYRNEGPDREGRKFEEIISWNDRQIENIHNFIQWLFPLPERSAFSPHAPLITTQDIEKFKSDKEIRTNIIRAFNRMLAFYGLEFIESSRMVKKSSSFEKKSIRWITPGNHNFLRITRMLRSLSLLGFEDLSKAFFVCLEEIYRSRTDVIGNDTFAYWKTAAAAR